MDKKKFDEIMDQWVAHELDTAPDLRPNQDVYRKLEEKGRKPKFTLSSWPMRLAAAGIAAGLIVLVIVLQPPKEVEPLLGLRKSPVADVEEKEEVADRLQALGEEESAAEKGLTRDAEEDVRRATKAEQEKLRKEAIQQEEAEKIQEKVNEAKEPPVKPKVGDAEGKTKDVDKEGLVRPLEDAARQRIEEAPVKKDVRSKVERSPYAAVAAAAPAKAKPERIEFQYQQKGMEAIKGLDLDSRQDEILSLASEESYRLKLEIPEERYVYVFQVGAGDHPARLFPNPEYTPLKNPLLPGETAYVPLPPNWFFVAGEEGQISLYVVTSEEPLYDWDDVGTRVTPGWLNQLELDRINMQDRISLRVFKFHIR